MVLTCNHKQAEVPQILSSRFKLGFAKLIETGLGMEKCKTNQKQKTNKIKNYLNLQVSLFKHSLENWVGGSRQRQNTLFKRRIKLKNKCCFRIYDLQKF